MGEAEGLDLPDPIVGQGELAEEGDALRSAHTSMQRSPKAGPREGDLEDGPGDGGEAVVVEEEQEQRRLCKCIWSDVPGDFMSCYNDLQQLLGRTTECCCPGA